MLRVQLVGSMRVWLDGQAVEQPSSRRAWALLAWLTLHPGLHARATVAATFWPDVTDASARANLRSAVWALRRSLGADTAAYLHLDRDRIGLHDDAPVRVDVRQIAELTASGQLHEAARLGTGELLAELTDEWATVARDTFRQDLIHVLELLALEAEADGDVLAAVAWSSRQAELDPLAEGPQCRLMKRLAAAGDRAAAVHTYRRLQDRLARALGISPDQETQRLAHDLMQTTTRAIDTDVWPSAKLVAGARRN